MLLDAETTPDHGPCDEFINDPVRRAIEGFAKEHPTWRDLKCFILHLSDNNNGFSVITHFTLRQLQEAVASVNKRSTQIRKRFMETMKRETPKSNPDWPNYRKPTMYELLKSEFFFHPSMFPDNRWYERGLDKHEKAWR